MSVAGTLQSTDQLGLGDHVCMVYETEIEHARILTPYLKAGLERNEKVVYLSDYTTGATVLQYLQGAGVDVEPALRKGQLSVHSASHVYLANGSFDPAAMLRFLAEATSQAIRERYAGLRATGEMTWVLEGRPGCDRILEYEARTNGFFTPHARAVGLCQYRRSRFEPRMLLEILKTHPIAGVGQEFYENPFYIPPETYLGPGETNAMLERCLAAIQHQPPLRRRASTLQEPAAPGVGMR
ncbi:MAG TPA: MEDS domain-containing protein [Planctomycetota bacterium]|nr:MEDS domain-containing protein [Planctomycetota bacterium]